MTATECVKLVAYIASRCPAMRVEDTTAAAWYHGDLEHVDHNDGIEAAQRLTRRQNFVSLAELLTECETVRRERVGRERTAAIAAQIERENAGELRDRPVASLTVGQPISQVLARTVREAKLRDIQAGTQAAGESDTQREQARLEIERLRQAQPEMATADGGADANA